MTIHKLFNQDLKKVDFNKIILGVLAVALQIQVTILETDNYLGLRVNLADFVLPFFCLTALALTLLKKATLPKWIMPCGWIWIAGLIAIMTIALLQGHAITGTWSLWAFFNKYIGFWILISYMVLGGWIASNTKTYIASLQTFITFFCGFFVFILALTVILVFAQTYMNTEFSLPHNPWAGYMVNRNAYMVVAVFVMICITLSYTNDKLTLPNWICRVFWFLFPFFLIHNASRTGWIVMALLVVIFICKHPKLCLKKISLPILAGIGLLIFSIYGAGIISAQGKDQYTHFMELINAPEEDIDTGRPVTMYSGDERRLIAVEDGMELYTKSGNPLLGAGLGSYKPFQIEKRGKFIDVMDFTGLWLLVETGALGLLSFSAFFAICLYGLFKRWRSENTHPLQLAVLIFMLCFAAMSMLHELLYTRFLWFIMGLAIAQNICDKENFRTKMTA